MPTVYLRKDLYDAIVQGHRDPNTVVNDLIEKSLRIQPPETQELKGKFKVGDKVRWGLLVGRVKRVYAMSCYGVSFPGHLHDEGFDDRFFNEDELALAVGEADAELKSSPEGK